MTRPLIQLASGISDSLPYSLPLFNLVPQRNTGITGLNEVRPKNKLNTQVLAPRCSEVSVG